MSVDGSGIHTSNNGPITNVRVFIHWHDQTVFAGEEVKCTIEFKNVARPPGKQQPQQYPPSSLNGRGKTTSSGLVPPTPTHHRLNHSITVPSAASRARAESLPWSPNPRTAANGHHRSQSILSIGSGTSSSGEQQRSASPRRVRRGHARSSSLHIVPRSPPLSSAGPRSATHLQRPYNSQASPLYNSSFPPDLSVNGRSGSSTAPTTPGLGISPSSPRPGSEAIPDFKFPMAPPPKGKSSVGSPRLGDEQWGSTSGNGLAVRLNDAVPTINEDAVAPAAQILSTTSIAGTPRSSVDFYSLSNHSTETLASEYTNQPLRNHGWPPHLRKGSSLLSQSSRLPETLMMGYAQIQGSFTLDASLINAGPFESVKRKAMVGGQGGGVVGIETGIKRDSGILRSLGWGSFGNSIGELLGGGELSSIKELRSVATSKSIPLLSTPHSILFVDLQLGPGESKAYEYAFTLPKGLPPTHRGKAIKINYSLVIGTQRPGGAREQLVRSIEIPFRVLGSVNSHGEILGHDLMSPYIVLRDQARVQSVDHHQNTRQPTKSNQPPSTMHSFLSYVEELLSKPQDSSTSLASPTAMPSSRRPSHMSFSEDAFLGVHTAKEAIDLAILNANVTGPGQQSQNRFEIARNGRRVAVVMLVRPAYRLGEVVTMAIDFAGAQIPCYAVHAALETTETVDPSLALRSEASLHRVTRKVLVAASEAALYARRVVFSPTIPISATPEFITSGVSLDWKIRLEFVVPVQDDMHNGANQTGDGAEESDGSEMRSAQGRRRRPHPLLEPVSRDERGGLVLVALEDLTCESFEVVVPLRVYGAVCNGLERLERDDVADEGLMV